MATASDSSSSYLPPLTDCLEGGLLLFSWQQVLFALQGHRRGTYPRLDAFLRDDEVFSMLVKPYDPFPAPSSSTKSAFDKFTAPINLSPSPSSLYSIAELKEDALWLSKEVKIDELSALRTVILEYQSRPKKQLLDRYAPEEIQSLKEAAGQVNTETSALIPDSTLPATKDETSQQTQSLRRTRLFRQYLDERTHILKCAQLLLQNSPADQLTDTSPYQLEVGVKLLATVLDNVGQNAYLVACTTHLSTICEALKSGSGMLQNDPAQAAFEVDWFTSQLMQVTLTMELVLWFLEAQKGDSPRHDFFPLCPESVILAWFRFASANAFFHDFAPPFPAAEPLVGSIQALVATVSLSLIDPWSAMSYFDDRRPPQDNNQEQPYIINLDCIEALNPIITDAAQSRNPVASPAILAWSIVLQEARSTSVRRREARELKQSQKAIDGLEPVSVEDDGADFRDVLDRPRSTRRNSAGSEMSLENGLWDKIMEKVMDTEIEGDPIEFLGRIAIDECQVLDILSQLATTSLTLSPITQRFVRITVLDCIRCTSGLLGYIPEVLAGILAALNGNESYWNADDTSRTTDPNPVAAFILDNVLRNSILGMAISRFPYESLPFLKLVRAIASYSEVADDDGLPMVLTWLGTLRSITYQLPCNFRDYETIQEEDNTNTIRSTTSIPLFRPRGNRMITLGPTAKSEGDALGSEDFIMPAGTIGRIVSDSEPKIAVWWHEISGLKYLGKLLETVIISGDLYDATTGTAIERESAAEIVGLLAVLLRTSHALATRSGEKTASQDAPHRILEEASDGLSRSRDIVTVVFAVFEEELQKQAEGSGESLELLITCIQFMCALIPILPGRVWPLIARSGLLDLQGRGSGLASVLTAVELVSSRYDFLIACTHLFDALVKDAAHNAIVRKVHTRSNDRFTNADPGTGVPSHVLSSVLFSFTRTVSEVFAASCNWRYLQADQRLKLSSITSTVLESILHYTYSIDDIAEPTVKLTSAFASAANHIVETFLSSSTGSLQFQPFLRALIDGSTTPDSTILPHATELCRGHVMDVLRFATTLIRLSSLVERPLAHIKSHFFSTSPLIVRLYAIHEAYQNSVIQLLDALVISNTASVKEPPSLLGHLGPETSKNFLAILSSLGKPLDDDAQSIAIWRLLSSVVSCRQQWFTIYLLTGRTPRASYSKKEEEETKVVDSTKTILGVAIAALEHIATISAPKAVAMLEFVSLSQNFWPWAMGDLIKSGDKFIEAIAEHVARLRSPELHVKEGKSLQAAYNARMAALIAEILAMYLYHVRQLGGSDKIMKSVDLVVTNIAYYQVHAVAVPLFNTSLYGNLQRNFETKFPGCTLQNFKRTGLQIRERGRNYYYDLDLADEMLSTNRAWTGMTKHGLREEMASVNLNLTLVETQVSVMNGWKMLVTELSQQKVDNSKTEALQRILARTALACLNANTRAQLPENIFAQLNQTRADLALILMQRLVETKSKIPETLELLNIVWETICQYDTSLEQALASDDSRSLEYYRTLLKIIFLSLRPHATVHEDVNKQSHVDSTTPTIPGGRPKKDHPLPTARAGLILELITRIVFHGLRDLSRAIHELPDTVLPSDISLLTGILQACLSTPGMEFCHEQILLAATTSDVARVCTTLFSWSVKLAVDGDPIYGELSVLFLLELSSVPVVAEQLAIDGVLGQIASASITGYLRRPGVSPFADSAGFQRCYSIWVRGILPLLLNLLDAVGASIAAELAIFLNQFEGLLAGSLARMDTPGSATSIVNTSSTAQQGRKYLCLSIAQELSCLALITFVLQRLRDGKGGAVDIPAVKWDANEVRENVEWWLGSRSVLRERIVGLDNREVEWSKMQATRGLVEDAKSRLEEIVVLELERVREVLGGGE